MAALATADEILIPNPVARSNHLSRAISSPWSIIWPVRAFEMLVGQPGELRIGSAVRAGITGSYQTPGAQGVLGDGSNTRSPPASSTSPTS